MGLEAHNGCALGDVGLSSSGLVWDPEGELASLVKFRLDADLTLVGFDNKLDDREAEAVAARAVAGSDLLEFVKNSGLRFLGDTATGVGHLKDCARPVASGTYRDGAPDGRKFNGVSHQVVHHSLKELQVP